MILVWGVVPTAALGQADLVDVGPQYQTISATELGEGQLFAFSHRIANVGDNNSEAFTVTYYTTTDQIVDGVGEKELKAVDFEKQEPSALGFRATIEIEIENPPLGDFYLCWEITTTGVEISTNNTGVHPTVLRRSPPPPVYDLRDAGFNFQSISATNPDPGTSFNIRARIRNHGPEASDGFGVLYWMSEDTTIDGEDDIEENDEANNIDRFGKYVRVGAFPNLRAGTVPFSLSDTEPAPGQSVILQGSQRNSGSSDAGPNRSQVLLSLDGLPSSDDLILHEVLNPAGGSPAGGEFEINHSITIPANVPPGEYVVIYQFDMSNLVAESHEGDNLVLLDVSVEPSPATFVPRIVDFIKLNDDDVRLWWASSDDFDYLLHRSETGDSWKIVGDRIPGEKYFTEFEFEDALEGYEGIGLFLIEQLPKP